ncbi:Rrp7p CYBJADRAFT_188757 [Cyberlindnera jadinii NRRL Y-1542]|uniref:RRP7 protein n=1 Tax=Cyberlindnera jadinii (strain ATCC 18201 / CBS 1600 / BCRC 20928 / JCM 3617 / NBRC 0987 / NRRL Y-1542) TaxID=983966 RepID=A0A1E4S837_CYBJN|nr:hypothetical protein CYBJADRAFT_188757 [Cyberlindnera jadinii NRRL Y-1542]ODV75671.1 hypothetical protein CYBJADRAFT_188757 [Cyberlindnera jadinii NRRL Y-1542]
MEEVKGFSVVPVELAQSQWNKKARHYMFIKKHQSNAMKEMAERSLFIVNPPFACTLSTIRQFFKSIASNSLVENLFINDEDLDYDINLTRLTSDLYDDDKDGQGSLVRLPNGTAIVVFVDKSACSLAMSKLKKYCKGDELYSWRVCGDETATSIRMAKAYRDRVLSPEETSAEVSLSLQEFEKREAKSIEELGEMKTLVDEDGFTMVVGKNRKTKRGILGKMSGTSKVKEIEDKKLKRKEKADFYRFQIREKKKLEMNELLKKFRDDQERIKELKEKKRFRPY